MLERYIFLINHILILGLIYFIFCYVIFVVSMWKIFKKENIKEYYSLIPFVNIYFYFKICNLPFWSIFVPLVNVIVFYCSFYVIAKQYRCKRWLCVLSIFFPYIILPYIAFSDKKNINFKYNNVYLKNNDDVNKLEDKLLENLKYDNIENDYSFSANVVSSDESPKVDIPIEEDFVAEEYIYNDFDESNNENQEKQIAEGIVELEDELAINELTIANLEKYEKDLDISSSTEKRINTDIKEYKGVEASNESIAFGGEERKEEIYELEAKHDDLKCERCGSSLVGAVNNVCPGCGAPIENDNQ